MDDYIWSDTAQKPLEYLKGFKGPEMVKMTFEEDALDLGPKVDTKKPFLLYSHRRRTKVYADMVEWDANTKSYVKKGPAVEIPKDYIGWFEVVPPGAPSTSFMTSLSEVSETGSECFLTRTALHGFTVKSDDSQGLELGPEHQIPPGEVLKITKICSKQWKTTGPTSDIKAETKFLQCVDFHGVKIVVSLAHPGQFSIVANTYDKSQKCSVYQICTLIGAIEIPAVVNLIFGWMPRISDTNQFQGYFRLNGCKRPNSFILHQVQNEKVILTELPFDADFQITTALKKEAIQSRKHFKKAVHFCRDLVYPFAVNIKGLEQPYSQEKDVDTGSTARTALMPEPTDMKAFRRSDVYPPLESQLVAEFWSLSFKDPESVLGTIVLETQGESTDTDPGRQGSPMSTIRRQARLRAREQYGMHDNRDSGDGSLNVRKPKRIEEIALREAKC